MYSFLHIYYIYVYVSSVAGLDLLSKATPRIHTQLVGWLVTAWQCVCVTEPGAVQAVLEDWHSASFEPAV